MTEMATGAPGIAYAGGGLAKGGNVTLYVDGQKVGDGQVGATAPLLFSADEDCDVGKETGSMVTSDYAAETSKFNGTISWIRLDQGADDQEHLISAEERLRVAMARH
jgi:arylsulfatase